MPNSAPSTKRLLIDKANTRTVVYVSVAAFVLIFSLVATKTLVSQAQYQNRVISKKKAAVTQLKADISASTQLKTSYNAFIGTSQNVIGGSTEDQGQQDGDNAKIVLDALPSGYDFPGLTTSLENLIGSQNVKISGITGTDDEIAQSSNQTSVNPQPVPIPFTLSVSGDYSGIQNVVSVLGRSIRPMEIQKLDISGNSSQLSMTVTAQTYYQPAKSLSINKVVVK